jgi:hypothetical protein
MSKTKTAMSVKPGNQYKHSVLSGYQYQLDKQAKAEEDYERAFNRATMTTSYIRPDNVQGGDKKDLYDKVNYLQPLKEKVRAELLEAVRMRGEISKYIKAVESVRLRLILQLLYIEGVDYGEAFKRMKRCGSIEDLHNEALKAVVIE